MTCAHASAPSRGWSTGRRVATTGATRSSRSARGESASNAWLPDDPYPLADVDHWPDDDPERHRPGGGAADDRSAARVRARQRGGATALGEMAPATPDRRSTADPHRRAATTSAAAAHRSARRSPVDLLATAALGRAAGAVREPRPDDAAGSCPVLAWRDRTQTPCTDTSPAPSTCAASPTTLGEVVDMVSSSRTTPVQETVDPLKGAGRWIGYGAAGAVLLGSASCC